MVNLKGLTSGRNILLILGVVALVSFLAFYPAFISAADPYVTVRVANIVNNDSIQYANVSLINCSDAHELLGYGLTAANGSVWINLSENGVTEANITPGFMIYVNTTGLMTSPEYYFNASDDNNSVCYNFTTDAFTEEMYPTDKGSFNITVKDYVSGRPVPNARVMVYEYYNVEHSQADNYRCDSGECTTDDDGNIMLFATAAHSGSTVNYFFSVSHSYYDNWNTTMQTYSYDGVGNPQFSPGMNRDEEIRVNGSTTVSGYVFDAFNSQPVADADVTLVQHNDSTHSTQIGFDSTYFYNVTTDADGKYEIKAPTDLLNCTLIVQLDLPRYDINVTADGYISSIDRNPSDGSNGYCGSQNIGDIHLTGEVNVSGTVLDDTTKQPIESASVLVYNETINYTALTLSDGSFLVPIKNVSNYTISITMSGYEDSGVIVSYDGYDGNYDLGHYNLTGAANITGRILDVNRNSANQYILLPANVTLSGGTYPYTASSGSDGNFQVYVRSGVAYVLDVSRPGYNTNSSSFTASDGLNYRGDITLEGKFKVNGTVRDVEDCTSNGCRYAGGVQKPEINDVDVYVFDLNNVNTYKAETDSNGKYSVSIPSEDPSLYTVKFYAEYVKDGYHNTTLDNNGNGFSASAYPLYKKLDAYLLGDTTIDGKVRDAYSPSGSNIFIENAKLEVLDYNSGVKLYEIETDPDGSFAIDMGIGSNYKVLVSKSGYGNSQYGHDIGGYSAAQDITFGPSDAGYMQLTGLANVYGVVRDTFSGYPVNMVTVTVKGENGDGVDLTYLNSSINGSYGFWIDSTILNDLPYTVSGQADGYTKKLFEINSSDLDMERDINLTAYFQTIVKDAENDWGIQNAKVQLYHYYNQTDFNPLTSPNITYLNETTLNVTVSCGGNSTFSYINVTLVKDSCPSGSSEDLAGLCYRSQNTSGGYTFFETVAIGDYDVTVDGTVAGCSFSTETLLITSSAAGLDNEVSYSLDETSLSVRVVDPLWNLDNSLGILSNADVNLYFPGPGPYTNATPDNDGSGIYTFHFVRSGFNDVSADDPYHFWNQSRYNVTPGQLNDFTATPIVLEPLPANMSIHVTNMTSDAAEAVNVTISGVIKSISEVSWTFKTGDNVRSSPAIASDGTIYFGSNDGNLTALYPDGTQKWNYTTGGTVRSSPAVASDGTIYVGSNDNVLYAIYPNGNQKWNYTTGGTVQSSPAVASDGTVYVGSEDDNLYAIYPNGTLKWSYTAGSFILESSPTVASDGIIYIGSLDNNLTALYPNGTLKWNYTTGGSIQSSPAISSDGIIYIGSNDNALYAIYPNGTLKWSHITDGYVDSSPAVASDGTIYVGSNDNNLTALYPNGTLKWNYKTGGEVESSPAVASDGTIYVGSNDNVLYAIWSDGTLRWSYTTGGSIQSSPAISSDGTVYVGSDDENLYAITPYSIENSTLTDSNGWANFTDVYPSVYWNITVNGTERGYNYTILTDMLLGAGNLTVVNSTLRENTLLVHVYALNDSVIDAEGVNVTLFNQTGVAKNATGSWLSGLTNSTGEVFFTRIIPGLYNISVNGTEQGYNTIVNVTMVIGINENYASPVLNDSDAPQLANNFTGWWNSTDWVYNITKINQSETLVIYSYWTENSMLSEAILQVNDSTGNERNIKTKSITGTSSWSNFTTELDSTYTNTHAGEDIYWRVIARDANYNWNYTPWNLIHINDTIPPAVSVDHSPVSVVAGLEVLYTVTVTDNYNVSTVDLAVDYDGRAGDTDWECNVTTDPVDNKNKMAVCTWKSTGYAIDTVHYYFANATDADGNVGRDPDEEYITDTGYDLPTGRSWGAGVAVNNLYPERIYVIGGHGGSGDVRSEILRFNPDSPGQPTAEASLPQSRRSIGAAYHEDNSKIYIFGGFDGALWYTSTYEYELSSETVTNVTSGATWLVYSDQVNSPAAVYLSTNIYLFGGDDGTSTYSDRITAYNSGGTRSSPVTLAGTRSKAAAVTAGSDIYIIGGVNGTGEVRAIEKFTPPNTVTKVADLPLGLEGVSAAYHEETGMIYIFGGYDGPTTYENAIVEFDPSTDSILRNETNASLPTGRAFTYSAFSGYDDKFYIFGGFDGTTHLSDILKYDPIYGKSFKVGLVPGNLTLNINDSSSGSLITDCLGGSRQTRVRLYRDSLPTGHDYSEIENATNGVVTFYNLYPGLTYNVEVNGTMVGYGEAGFSSAETVYVGQGSNTDYVELDQTKLGVYVYNSSDGNQPIEGVSFQLYYPGGSTPAVDCDNGQLQGSTGSNGYINFTRLLPCSGCVFDLDAAGSSKDLDDAAVSDYDGTDDGNIEAGDDFGISIDPPLPGASLGTADSYYVDTVGDRNTLNVSVWGRNSTDDLVALVYANVSFVRDDGIIADSNITDASGLTTINVSDGVYNITVDGEGIGYMSVMVENVKIGKLVFAEGLTDSNGQFYAVVDGQPTYTPLSPSQAPGSGYYAVIKAAGYGVYDTYEKGDDIFTGTYYDSYTSQGFSIDESFRKEFYGTVMISGHIGDNNCQSTQCEDVEGSALTLKIHGPGTTRYTNVTPPDGQYIINVSPYTPDSTWDSPVTQPYDMNIILSGCYNDYNTMNDGYASGMTFSSGQTVTKDVDLVGTGTVWGHVYRQGTTLGVSGANVSLLYADTWTYYESGPSESDGYFNMTINPCHSPYSLYTHPPGSEAYTSGYYSGSQSDVVIGLFGTGQGGFLLVVKNETGDALENANVSLVGPQTYNLVTNSSGMSYISSLLSFAGSSYYDYNLTVDGSHLGYYINSSIINIPLGSVGTYNLVLNATQVNITLSSDEGDGIDGMGVTMNSSNFYNTTSNGSVLFSVVPTGVHTVTLSGDKTLVYFNGSGNVSGLQFTINVTKADAGEVRQVGYTFSETMAVVNITNSTYYGLSRITTTITNGSDSYTVDSNATGYAVFREVVPASNYTVTFNSTQLQGMGFVVPQTFSINAEEGGDDDSGNIISAALQDVQVRFNITDDSSNGLTGIYVALVNESGSVVNNSYGTYLNGSTSSGLLTLHNVPSGTYTYYIDGNSSGYGIWNNSQVTVPTNAIAMVNETLKPITLTAYVYDSVATQVKENVNVSVLYATTSVTNSSGDTLSHNVTSTGSGVDFTSMYLYQGNYTANVTSPRYFSQEQNVSFGTLNPAETNRTVQFTLIERMVTVNVENGSGSALEESVNITIRDVSGAILLSTNESYYLNATNVTSSTEITHIPDESFSINVTSSLYFNGSQLFNVTNITDGIKEFNFTMVERRIYVILKNSTGDDLTQNVTVYLNNTDGSAVTDTTGSEIAPIVNTTLPLVNFSYVPDGSFYVNVTSDHYFLQSQSISSSDIATGTNNTLTFTMYEREVAVSAYDFSDRTLITTETVNITFYNVTGVAANTTGDNITASTSTGMVTFTGILDETFNVSAESANYTETNETFDPSSGQDTDVGIYLKKLNHGYFNLTVLVQGSSTLISGATVQLRNASASGTVIDSGTTGAGMVVLGVNTSEYDQSEKNMTFVVSASGYVTNSSTGYFNVSDQGVEGVNITLVAETPPSPPPDGGGGGGGGSSGGTVSSETQNMGTIEPGVEKTAKFLLSSTLNVMEVGVITDEAATDVSVKVSSSSKPSGSSSVISALDGSVYKYLDIDATNLQDSIITSATVKFKIPESWIDSNGIDPDEVYMYRYSGGAWSKLATIYLSTDGTWHYYKSTSPGFSTFAIVGYYYSDRDMEPTLYTTYIDAGECKTVYVTVSNTGGATLTNIHVEALEASWGTVTQSRGIASLSRGVQDRVSLKICADRLATKGSYDYSIEVISDRLSRTVSSKVQMTKTYVEVLTEQIDELESMLEEIGVGIDAAAVELYNSARDSIDSAKENINEGDYDEALGNMNSAREDMQLISEMEPSPGILNMFVEWIVANYILTAIIAAIAASAFSVVLFRKRITKELPEIPTGGEVLGGVMKAGQETIGNLMSIVRELETRVEGIDIESLGENERKWYNKVRLQIESVKRSIDGGDFKKAHRHVNDAELYMKMLELNTASS